MRRSGRREEGGARFGAGVKFMKFMVSRGRAQVGGKERRRALVRQQGRRAPAGGSGGGAGWGGESVFCFVSSGRMDHESRGVGKYLLHGSLQKTFG